MNSCNKIWLKKATGVDTSQIAKKDDLTNSKSELGELDIDKLSELDADKLKPIPTDLSELSDIGKRKFNAKTKNIEDKIPSITNLTTNASLDEINEFKGEIPSINNLATTTALNAVENN